MIPLFEFSSCAIINDEIIVPRNCKQFFNPQTATITTFLTSSHLLIEHYRFLKTPSTGDAVQFFINTLSRPHLDIYSESIQMESASVESIKNQSLIRYRFSFENLKGIAYSWMDCPSFEESPDHTEKSRFVSG